MDYYSLQDLSEITGLTDRTLRNYLREGILQGEKIAGKWQFTPENFQDFWRENKAQKAIQAEAYATVYDFLLQDCKTESCVCTIIDEVLPAGFEPTAVKCFSDMASAIQEQGETLRFKLLMKRKNLRIIVAGSQTAVKKFMEAYEAFWQTF